MIRLTAGIAVVLVISSAAGGCQPGDCGAGDLCPGPSTAVAGRVTSPDGQPVAGLRLQSEIATFLPAIGCDTTQMQPWNDALTGPTGAYVLIVEQVGFREEQCSFIRVAAPGNPGLSWNDTLVGPLQLGEFGTQHPRDTAYIDIVLQPAASASAR